MDPKPAKIQSDSDAERLEFILAAQEHCDHFLTPLADPAGKSVLVVGAGAGTEMLWCLRHGAREVVGLDVAPQRPEALAAAVAKLGGSSEEPAIEPRFSILEMGIEDAASLGRRFDLILSNNVFEHLPQLERAFEVCAQLVEPYRGRIAIFTDPLYYSSAGSHLPVEPWEHLWGEPEELRERLLAAGLGAGHPLRTLDLGTYLDREISLNRMRLGDFLEGVRKSGLAVLNLRLVRDRHLAELDSYRHRLSGLLPADLTIEGIAAELVRIEGPPPAGLPPYVSTEEAVLVAQRQILEQENHRLSEELDGERRRAFSLSSDLEEERRRIGDLRRGLDEVRQVLAGVEASPSFRIGRFATAPLRRLRDLFSR